MKWEVFWHLTLDFNQRFHETIHHKWQQRELLMTPLTSVKTVNLTTIKKKLNGHLGKTPRAAIFYSMKAAGKQIQLLPTS